MNQTLVEKYRPSSFEEIIGNKHIIEVLKRRIKNSTIQHMIFSGPPGCGKTTMAMVFASEYLGKKINLKSSQKDYAELNASNDRGIDAVRGYIKSFGEIPPQTRNSDGELLKRIMVLDEFDNTTKDFQMAFRSVSEKNQDNIIYIMIVNHKERIKEKALLSRAMCFDFDPQPSEKIGLYFKKIAKKEGIKFANDKIIFDILDFPEYQGDFRRIINDTLQKLVGIDHMVDKKDLNWIYKDSYNSLIDAMIKTNDFFNPFFSIYKKKAVNCPIFVAQLLKRISPICFDLAKVFSDIDYRLKNGGDELVQMTALLTACEVFK